MVINGLGRQVSLKPILNDTENGITGFIEARVVEGQFENDLLNGFGRIIRSDGYSAAGWWRNGHLMGFAKQIWPDKSSREGLYENMPKDMRYVRMYDVYRDIKAKEINFERYITFTDEVASKLKQVKEAQE